MSIYRITRFTSSNTEKAVQMAQAAREEVAALRVRDAQMGNAAKQSGDVFDKVLKNINAKTETNEKNVGSQSRQNILNIKGIIMTHLINPLSLPT